MSRKERLDTIEKYKAQMAEEKLKLYLLSLEMKVLSLEKISEEEETLIWKNANEGKVIKEYQQWNTEDLISCAKENFTSSTIIYTLFQKADYNFKVGFEYNNMDRFFRELTSDSSDLYLLTILLFEENFNEIMLISETEYSTLEIIYYKREAEDI